MPAVSVVVPSYNLASVIRETLDSVKRQTFADFEVIVVDDGSTDDSVRIIKTYTDDSRFKLITQSNQGTATARNTAIRVATGEWIAFLDADDIWMPDNLFRRMVIVHQHPAAAMVFSNGMEFTESGDFGPFYRSPDKLPDGADIHRFVSGNCVWASSVMVRRTDVMHVGMLRTDVSGVDDYDLWLKILEMGGVARGAWEQLVKYRKRPDSLGTRKIYMYETLAQVYVDALKRNAGNTSVCKIASDSLARASSDVLLARARQCIEQGLITESASEILAAWREYPRRVKILSMYLQFISGQRRPVIRRLVRKW